MALYGLTDADRRAIADSLRRDFAGKVSRRPVPRRNRPLPTASAAAELKTGVISSGTSATNAQNGNDLTLGTIQVWEYLSATELDTHDASSSYDDDKPVYLTGQSHSETADYPAGSYVENGGTVYENQSGSTITAGTFASQSGDWTSLGNQGVYFASGNQSAGSFDGQTWDAATGTQFIDRTRATIALDNHFTDTVTGGAIVKWLGTRLIGYGCSAQAGWS